MEGYTGYALRFLSGKYEGSEYPLKSHQEINVGRGAGLELVLIEDMVSRHHTRFITTQSDVMIQDMNSTNGTFVNGERIRKSRLKDGDRILIGTVILQVVPISEETLRLFEEEHDPAGGTDESLEAVAPASVAALPAVASQPALPAAAPAFSSSPALPAAAPLAAPAAFAAPEVAAAPQAALVAVVAQSESFSTYEEQYGGMPIMSGNYHETSLSDLLELFASTRKSGVLVLTNQSQEGRLHLRNGRLASVVLNGRYQGNLKKMALRIMSWPEAEYAFYPPNDADIQQPCDENPTQLLRTAQRNAEKLRKYRNDIPEGTQAVVLQRPLQAPLRDLRPDYLDLIQQVFNHDTLDALSENSNLPEPDLYQRLSFLIRSGYLQVR